MPKVWIASSRHVKLSKCIRAKYVLHSLMEPLSRRKRAGRIAGLKGGSGFARPTQTFQELGNSSMHCRMNGSSGIDSAVDSPDSSFSSFRNILLCQKRAHWDRMTFQALRALPVHRRTNGPLRVDSAVDSTNSTNSSFSRFRDAVLCPNRSR